MSDNNYSIWIVPNNWEDIKTRYKMDHIPHITIKRELKLDESRIEKDKCETYYQIEFQDNVYNLSCLSSHLPNLPNNKDKKDCKLIKDKTILGFYCQLLGITLNHRTYMTLYYYNNCIKLNHTAPDDCLGNIYIANTNSINPSKWFLLN